MANLTEWLAADQLAILKTILKEIGQLFGENLKNKKDFLPLKTYPSDVVRSWACWAIASQQKTTKQLLTAMKPFAGDTPFWR